MLTEPVNIVIGERLQQRAICNGLEHIANNLSGTICRQLCENVLSKLNHDLAMFHRDEEALFEIILAHEPDANCAANCINLIKSEHETNEAYVLDLFDPLSQICEGSMPHYINAVGYALRCYFDGVRRHLNWEDFLLFGDRLSHITTDDTQELEVKLARNRSVTSRHLRLV